MDADYMREVTGQPSDRAAPLHLEPCAHSPNMHACTPTPAFYVDSSPKLHSLAIFFYFVLFGGREAAPPPEQRYRPRPVRAGVPGLLLSSLAGSHRDLQANTT